MGDRHVIHVQWHAGKVECSNAFTNKCTELKTGTLQYINIKSKCCDFLPSCLKI